MSSTVRLSQSLSDRLTERARAKGSSPEQLLDEMLQREEQIAAMLEGRDERLEAMGAAMERTTPAQWAEYREETRAWENAYAHDLEPEVFSEWNEDPAT